MGGKAPSTPANTTTTTKQELPAYAQPYAEELLSRGGALSRTGYEGYGGQRIADFSPEQQMAMDLQTQRALYGNEAVNEAQSMLTRQIRGDFLDPNTNPFLSKNVNTALDQVQGRVGTQFNQAGAFGGSANQELLSRNLGQTANEMYGANYAAERQNQQNAIQLAPTFGALDYADINALASVGDIYGERAQNLLNLQYSDWQEAQAHPYKMLDVLSNALAGSTGGRSTTIQSAAPQQYNRISGVLGGGLAGYGAGNMVGQSYPGAASVAPWAGAALGGALGYMG